MARHDTPSIATGRPQEKRSVGDVVQFPGHRRTGQHPPVVEGSVAPSPTSPEEAEQTPVATAAPARRQRAQPPPAKPRAASVASAGRLRYVSSVAGFGTLRAPVVVSDRFWDWAKLAPLREDGTHHTRVADRNTALYTARQQQRGHAAGQILKVASAPWTAWQVRIGKRHVPLPLLTWGVTAGCVSAVVWPENRMLAGTFGHLTTWLGELAGWTGDTLGAVAEPVGLLLLGATAVYGITSGIVAEQRARVAARTGPAGTATGPQPPEAGMLTAAFRAAGIIKTDGTLTLTGPVVQVPGGWRADIVLPGGYTVGMVRKLDHLDRLASALSTIPAFLSVTNGATSGSLSLTRYETLPFTGPPVAHPLLGGGRLDVARDGVPLGLDVHGQVVRVDIVRGRHGLIVASSGNGKTQHLLSLMLSLGMDPATTMALLDGKPDGTLDPLLPLVDAHVDASMDEWLERAADLLEAEVERCRERQQRIRNRETLGFRLIVIDEFQMFTGNTAAGGMKQDSPHRRIRTALEEINRLGRSALVGFVLASQSYDGRTIDAGALSSVGWRVIGYAPSDMSREALAEHAARYDLDTSKMLVDSEQTGTAVVISPGIDRYALARGWYQTTDAVTAAVKLALQQRAQAGITQAETTRPPLRAVRVPAELAVAADLARQVQEQGAPIVATAAILAALDDPDMTPHRLSHLLTGWTGHRVERQNFDGDQLRGPRVTHLLTAVDRINNGGPLTVDQPTEA